MRIGEINRKRGRRLRKNKGGNRSDREGEK